MQFLREFEALIGRIPLTGGPSVTNDDLRKKVFSMYRARTWLLNLPKGSLVNWNDIYKAFMEKYYPYSKTAVFRVRISQFE